MFRTVGGLAGFMTVVLLIVAPVSASDSVHDQSQFDSSAFGWDSVAGNADTQQIADDFKLAADGKVTVLNWAGKYHDGSVPESKMFEIRIFGDSGGRPGALIFARVLPVSAGDTGIVDQGDHTLLTYTVFLNGSPVLHRETTYWLSVRETDPSTSATWSWSFHSMDVAGGYSYRPGADGPWAVGTRDMAFSLSITPMH